jgi:hypothetical protein
MPKSERNSNTEIRIGSFGAVLSDFELRIIVISHL